MKAEIIAIGTELLMGQVVNTNATTIARFLNELGIGVYYQTVVGDNAERLTQQLMQSSQRSDLIVLCGGLGPTQDDITKEVIASFLNDVLVQHEPSKQKIIDYYASSRRNMTDNNLKQSLILKNSDALWNENGFAAGIYTEVDGVTYVVLPGPPRELERMLETQVRLKLHEQDNRHLESVLLRFADIGESLLASKLEDIITSQTNPTIAIYANPGAVDVRVTASGKTIQQAQSLLRPVAIEIQRRLSDFYYGRNQDTLSSVVAKLLQENNWSLSTAESLTGGLFGAEMTNVSGASSFYRGGIVAYTNEIKMNRLGVSQETIQNYGAISAECALEMAIQVKKHCQSDVGISFTGIADRHRVEGKPSGLVYIGIATPTHQKVVCVQLHRDRQLNRQLAVQKGLVELRKMLLEVENGN